MNTKLVHPGPGGSFLPGHKRFRVALSFPGTRRPFVEQVADALAAVLGRDSVFCDKYYEAELARPNLDLCLAGIYRDDADLVACFLCAEYDRSQWCRLEWRQMRDILKKTDDQRLMYFRFDLTEIAGLLSIDGYVEIADRTAGEIANLILRRVPGQRAAASILDVFPDLTSTDGLVLKAACESLMDQVDCFGQVETSAISERLRIAGVDESAVEESIEVLHNRGYIAGVECFGGSIPLFVVSTRVFRLFLQTIVPEYEALVERVAVALVTDRETNSAAIAAKFGQTEVVICHILEDLAQHNLIRAEKLFGGSRVVMGVSAELRRRVRHG